MDTANSVYQCWNRGTLVSTKLGAEAEAGAGNVLVMSDVPGGITSAVWNQTGRFNTNTE